MPTYEYACRSCKHTFEEFQSIKAPVLKRCPECGKSALERLVGTGAALIFKGSGFYQTDYRSESYRKAAEAESKAGAPAADANAPTNGATKPREAKAESTSGTNSEAKTESKPAKAEVPRAATKSAAKKLRKPAAKK
jgi:putative FmdB family regulatory protein